MEIHRINEVTATPQHKEGANLSEQVEQ